MAAQISSRGASRSFIVAVFHRALDWALKQASEGENISFPYPAHTVADWLSKAKDDCERDPLSPYGGTPFDADDPSTHWTKTEHFFTWYKNNVERKSKQCLMALIGSQVVSNARDLEKQRYCLSVYRTTVNLSAHHSKNRTPGGEAVELRRMPEPLPSFLSERLEGCVYTTEELLPPAAVVSVVTPSLPKATRKRKSSHKGSPVMRAKRSSRDEEEDDEDDGEGGYQHPLSLHPRCSPDSADSSVSSSNPPDYEMRDLFGEVALSLDAETVDFFSASSPSKWQQLISPFGLSLNSVEWSSSSSGEDGPALSPASAAAMAMLEEALCSPLLLLMPSPMPSRSPPKMRWMSQKLGETEPLVI